MRAYKGLNINCLDNFHENNLFDYNGKTQILMKQFCLRWINGHGKRD